MADVNITNTGSDKYNATATILFNKTCNINGPLENYTITVEEKTESKSNTSSETINDLYILNLKAEFRYSYKITTFNKFYNSTSETKRFDAPAGGKFII